MKKFSFSLSRLVSFLLVVMMITTTCLPVNAEDLKTEFSLEEIQELAVKNNRNLEKIDLLINQSTYAGYIYSNEYDRARSNSIGRYVMSKGDIAKKEQVDAAIAQYEQAGFQEGKSPSDYPGMEDAYNHYINLKLTSAVLGTKIAGSAEIIEGQLGILSTYGISDSTSLTKELRDKRDEARNNTDDLKRLKGDAEKQTRQMAALLGLEALSLEKKIATLEKAYNQYLKMTEVERIKKERGLTTKNDVNKLAVEASSYAKQLRYARANLSILKGNLNDLISREIDAPLKIKDFSIPELVTPAPPLEQAVKEALDNSYYFFKTERDIKDKKNDLDNIEDSNKKQIKKDEIAIMELDKEAKKVEITNKVKSIHASYEEKAKKYELALINYRTMEQEYEWDKLKCAGGLISKLMLNGTEVKYLQALSEKMEAGYDYYLMKMELALAQEGIFMPDDYSNLKSSLQK